MFCGHVENTTDRASPRNGASADAVQSRPYFGEMPRVSLHTLGCKLNFAETSTIARDFARRNYEVVAFGEPADVTVINTCTVTQQAEQKCRNVVRRAVKSSPDPLVIVTGCYAQLRPEEIARIDGVDLVVGNAEKPRLFEIAHGFVRSDSTQIEVSCIDETEDFGPAYSAHERTRAFLKVQDGCDYSCSFCTIPAARGSSRSATPDEVLRQAHEIAMLGYREVVLSGVNVGLYGRQQGGSLLDLLRRLDDADGIERFRISSIEPNLLTDEIIDFVADSDRFMPHFHVPLQSGDNGVLGVMRRRYRREVYAERVERILSRMPDACVGADVIVGSPSETDAAFDNTLSFIADMAIAYLHVFTYSERPGTAALDLTRRREHLAVPKQTRKKRSKELRLLSSRMRSAFHARFIGQTRPVLWEGAEHGGQMHGFTDNYVKVRAPHDETRVGLIENVDLLRADDDGVILTDDGLVLVEELI